MWGNSLTNHTSYLGLLVRLWAVQIFHQGIPDPRCWIKHWWDNMIDYNLHVFFQCESNSRTLHSVLHVLQQNHNYCRLASVVTQHSALKLRLLLPLSPQLVHQPLSRHCTQLCPNFKIWASRNLFILNQLNVRPHHSSSFHRRLSLRGQSLDKNGSVEVHRIISVKSVCARAEWMAILLYSVSNSLTGGAMHALLV